ncbi:MAG: TonB-dependent receptor [Prevotellaceae bacterium]|jgi:iron complex outermembrane receptor protein|nr:TonB-dependent receptor [Prevotellaceae bacterium]
MKKRLLFHLILLQVAVWGGMIQTHAQTDTSLYQLNKAEVSAIRRVGVSDMQRYSIGGTVYRADSVNLAVLRHTSLTDYISQYTPVYIRENGNGMMATASLRGTSSSHTTVTWNGLTINSLTMGQTDFSHLPTFFFDEVSVYPGGEGALYGNGAIGGTISLKTEPQKTEGISTDIQQTVGSFTHTFTGGKFLVNKRKWSTKTAALYNYNKNNFGFYNPEDRKHEKQHNASYHKFGILQEIYYRPSQQSTLSAKVWYMSFYREIQPMAQANNNRGSYDTIHDRNFIALLSFNHRADWAQLSASAAYLYDRQLFQKDVIATNRYAGRMEAEKYLFRALTVKIGGYAEYIVPDVHAYQSGVSEWRGDVYALLLYNITQRWDASLNLRQSFVSELNPPFTPSAGASYKLLDGATHQLKLRSTVSKSFRAPTLNDRYWNDNKNSDLKPETGVNIEGGADYTLQTPLFVLQTQFTVSQNRIDNWIRWYPRGIIWKPMNVNKVEAKGVEASAKLSGAIGKTNLSISGNYAYVSSKIIKGVSATDPNVGAQLPLLPQHRWNISADAAYKKTFAQLGFGYTGKTYSTDRNIVIDAYTLANVSGGYNFSIADGKHTLSLSGRINNLFNKTYQSVMFFAMTKRNWNISLRYIL